MQLPPNLTETEFLDAVEEVVRLLARRKAAFGYYDVEDLAQEVRIFCLQALPHFNPQIRPLHNFLFAHCKNRLINLHRDKVRRNDAPCSVCHDHFLGVGDGHEDGRQCPKYAAWLKRNNAKANLMRPVDLDEAANVADGAGDDTTVKAEGNELAALINERLPIQLRATYLQMMAGVTVPKHLKLAVQASIRDILDNAGLPVPPEPEENEEAAPVPVDQTC